MGDDETTYRVRIETESDESHSVTERDATSFCTAFLCALESHEGSLAGTPQKMICDMLEDFGGWFADDSEPDEEEAFEGVVAAAQAYIDLFNKKYRREDVP